MNPVDFYTESIFNPLLKQKSFGFFQKVHFENEFNVYFDVKY